jgi:hypothetical protein
MPCNADNVKCEDKKGGRTGKGKEKVCRNENWGSTHLQAALDEHHLVPALAGAAPLVHFVGDLRRRREQQ